MKKLFVVAAAAITFAAGSAHAEIISQPNSSPQGGAGPLSGWPYQGGSAQTTFIGQSFAASTTGSLTNLQFTLLDGSTLTSVQAIVYALNGPLATAFTPGAEIWRSSAVTNPTGLLNFNPVGVNVTAGQSYVAFLSTYYTPSTGSAQLSSCNVFIGGPACVDANANPSLGSAIFGNVRGANLDELSFSTANKSQDLTFSATIAPVPEPATWMMMIGGFGMLGTAMRRRPRVSVRYA